MWGLLQLATGQTVYRWETWNAFLNWATYLVLFFLALQLLGRPEVRRSLLRWALHFGFVLAIVSTAQMFTSGGKIFWLFPSGYKDFVMGPFVYHNEYAAFMEMILPVALWQALRHRQHGFAYFVMAGVIFASVVAGASRAGTLIMCLEACAILLLASWRGMLPRAVLIRGFGMVAVSAILFAAVVGWGPLWRRFRQPDPFGGRREFLTSSLAMVRDHPWMGAGLGNWPHVYPRYAVYDDGLYVTHAHNDWAEWAAEGGLPFLLICVTLAVWTLPAALRSLWGVGLAAIWLHCSVEYIFHQRPGLGACFCVLLAILAMEAKTRAAKSGPVYLTSDCGAAEMVELR
jgi:O-antigen ligase